MSGQSSLRQRGVYETRGDSVGVQYGCSKGVLFRPRAAFHKVSNRPKVGDQFSNPC